MTANLRLMRRLGGASALVALALALNACGRVEPPQTGAQAAPAPTTAAVASTDTEYPELPTVQVIPHPTPAPLPTIPPSNDTPVPVPASPNLGPVLSGDTVQIDSDFASSGDLSGWSFTQLFDDPVSAPAWTVEDGLLTAPANRESTTQFNDVLAITGPAQGPNYAFEATGLIRYSSVMGIVVGYTDSNNFIALLLAETGGSPNTKAGLQLVQYVNGKATVLAQDEATTLQAGSWYTLRAEVTGNQVKALVNGKQVFEGTASGTLGQSVGLYASFEGSTFFSAARLTVR